MHEKLRKVLLAQNVVLNDLRGHRADAEKVYEKQKEALKVLEAAQTLVKGVETKVSTVERKRKRLDEEYEVMDRHKIMWNYLLERLPSFSSSSSKKKEGLCLYSDFDNPSEAPKPLRFFLEILFEVEEVSTDWYIDVRVKWGGYKLRDVEEIEYEPYMTGSIDLECPSHTLQDTVLLMGDGEWEDSLKEYTDQNLDFADVRPCLDPWASCQIDADGAVFRWTLKPDFWKLMPKLLPLV